jgi:hypothetical protein
METIKVYLNEHKLDDKGQSTREVIGKKVIEVELLEKRDHSILVKLPDGRIIVRKQKHIVKGE